MRPTPDSTMRGLADRFLATHDGLGDSLRRFEEFLIRTDDGAVLPPYIPFVGERYSDARLLVLAKAQNLAQWPKLVETYDSRGADSAYRLWPPSDAASWSYSHIPIAPFSCGVLPALAGVCLYARTGLALPDLHDVTARLAVSNYHKYSLYAPGKKRDKKDLNPDAGGNKSPFASLRSAYARLSYESYVVPEVETLDPQLIICLKGPGEDLLRADASQAGRAVFRVNDPSWILQGASALSPGKRWHGIAANVSDPKALELVEGYCDQIQSNGGAGRYAAKARREGPKGPIRAYLLRYFAEVFKPE